MDHWDRRFLGLAEHIAGWSKDPSTKVGAVIADPNHRIRAVGFNGFAAGVIDAPTRLQDRDTKYLLTLHAEENALAFATDPQGCTLYASLAPCAHCMSLAVQRGITRVVAPTTYPLRWAASIDLARQIAEEAGLTVELV